MKVIITGVTGLRNRGVEALVKTTIEQICLRHSDVTFDVLTETLDYDQMRLSQDNVNWLSMKIAPQNWQEKLQAKGAKFNPSLAPEYSRYQDAALIIASGGDLFTADYPGALAYQLQPLKLSLHAGVPVVFLGQSIAFKTKGQAEEWLEVARQAKLITVRENISYRYVTEELGLPPEKVKCTADSAFLLEPTSGEEIANLIQSFGINEDQPLVAIAPSQGISRFAASDYEQHFNSWRKVVTMILEELDAQVLIIPHVQNNSVRNDDRILASKLYRSLKFHPRVHLAGTDHSASEFKGLFAASDLVIAERMHAAIAGLSSGVCTLVVGYSVKGEGIMTDLFGAESIRNGLLISVQDFLNPESACQAVRKAWQRRNEVAEHLKDVLPGVKEKAASNFEMISQILA